VGSESKPFLIEGLTKFRIPEAEPTLLRWAKEVEEGGFGQTMAVTGLCEILAHTEESRELIRDTVVREAYDRSFGQVETVAIPLGIILGRPFEEEPQWRQRVEESDRRAIERRGFFEKTLGKRSYKELVKGLQDRLREPHTPSATRTLEPPSPPAKLVGAKSVGRNDPCPCGSGKKYKKCCLGK
jgi:uncharacterized protein YecA (UPF0149 family)